VFCRKSRLTLVQWNSSCGRVLSSGIWWCVVPWKSTNQHLHLQGQRMGQKPAWSRWQRATLSPGFTCYSEDWDDPFFQNTSLLSVDYIFHTAFMFCPGEVEQILGLIEISDL
jgi:hypothetical protein